LRLRLSHRRFKPTSSSRTRIAVPNKCLDNFKPSYSYGTQAEIAELRLEIAVTNVVLAKARTHAESVRLAGRRWFEVLSACRCDFRTTCRLIDTRGEKYSGG
jgi:hypothetical protein